MGDSKVSSALFRVMVFICTLLAFSARTGITANPPLEPGDYVSSKYLEVLDKTCSPFAAEGGREINLITVIKTKNDVEVMPVTYFHEGVHDAAHGGGTFSSSIFKQLHFNSVERFFWFDQSPEDKFVFLNNIDRYVSQKCISGNYVDKDGRSYAFNPDGTAITPIGVSRFYVGTDHSSYQFDYIGVFGTDEIYKFVRKKCSLNLFKVLDAVENQHGNDGSHVVPFALLREVDCKVE